MLLVKQPHCVTRRIGSYRCLNINKYSQIVVMCHLFSIAEFNGALNDSVVVRHVCHSAQLSFAPLSSEHTLCTRTHTLHWLTSRHNTVTNKYVTLAIG